MYSWTALAFDQELAPLWREDAPALWAHLAESPRSWHKPHHPVVCFIQFGEATIQIATSLDTSFSGKSSLLHWRAFLSLNLNYRTMARKCNSSIDTGSQDDICWITKKQPRHLTDLKCQGHGLFLRVGGYSRWLHLSVAMVSFTTEF